MHLKKMWELNDFRILTVFVPIVLVIFIFSGGRVGAQILFPTFQFTQNLTAGDRSPEVLVLQQFLNTDPMTRVQESGAGSSGFETNFFGPATLSAVIRFQEKYASEILIPVGLNRGTGFVGNQTQAKLNSLLTLAPTSSIVPTPEPSPMPSLTIPIITELSPNHGPNGTKITIKGEHFTSVNTVVTNFMEFPNISSKDGQTLEFTFDNPPFAEIQRIRTGTNNIEDVDIPFYVTVINENGTSTTPILFTIQIRK